MTVDYQKVIFNTDDSVLLEHMKKYNISQKMLDDSLDQLILYFKMQPHLPNINKDDPRFGRILAINKYSIEKTKRKIENIFTARTMLPDFFLNRDIRNQEIRKYIGAVDIIIMPKLTPENRRIIIFKLTTDNVDLFDPIIYYKINFMIADFRLTYETVYDDVYITELSYASVQHVTKMNPVILKKITYLSQECYSSKIKALHVVNVPSYVNNMIKIFKSFLKKKIADRLHIHTNMESLHKLVPKDCLPTEFNGTAGDSRHIRDKLFNCLESSEWRQKFLDMENEKSDESKRPEGSNKNFDFSGGSMDGSFRRLDID